MKTALKKCAVVGNWKKIQNTVNFQETHFKKEAISIFLKKKKKKKKIFSLCKGRGKMLSIAH